MHSASGTTAQSEQRGASLLAFFASGVSLVKPKFCQTKGQARTVPAVFVPNLEDEIMVSFFLAQINTVRS